MSKIQRSPAPSSGGLTKEQEEKIAGVPAAGTTGQVLTKKSNASYDDEWAASAGGPPSGSAGGDLEGSTYPNPVIAAEKVTTGKIKLLAITAALLAGEAVETAKIKAAAITEALLAAEAVAEAKIKALAVTAGKLGEEAVTTAKIATGAVTAGKLSAEPEWKALEAVNAKLEAAAGFAAGKVALDGLAFVHLRGVYKLKEEILAKGVLFTLPASCRPETERMLVTVNHATNVVEALKIKVNGEVETQVKLSAAGFISLDGCNFSLKG